MSISSNRITAYKILELIQQLSEADQQWLNQQLHHLLQQSALAASEKENLVDHLCGSWADDKSITPIFAEIEQQRALSSSREVSFDAPS